MAPFDEQPEEVHGECRAEIERLTRQRNVFEAALGQRQRLFDEVHSDRDRLRALLTRAVKELRAAENTYRDEYAATLDDSLLVPDIEAALAEQPVQSPARGGGHEVIDSNGNKHIWCQICLVTFWPDQFADHNCIPAKAPGG